MIELRLHAGPLLRRVAPPPADAPAAHVPDHGAL